MLFWGPESTGYAFLWYQKTQGFATGYAFLGPGVQFSVSICTKLQPVSQCRSKSDLKNMNWPMLWDWGLCVLAALRKTSFWICCEQLAGIWYLLCSVRQDMHYAFSKYGGYPCDHAFNFILPSISVWLRQPHKVKSSAVTWNPAHWISDISTGEMAGRSFGWQTLKHDGRRKNINVQNSLPPISTQVFVYGTCGNPKEKQKRREPLRSLRQATFQKGI